MTGPDSEGLQAEAVPGSASASGSSQCAVADVLTRPDTSLRSSGFDQHFLVVGEAHRDDVGARVVTGWSAGSRAHVGTIAYTENLAPLNLYVYDKSMNAAQYLAQHPKLGSNGGYPRAFCHWGMCSTPHNNRWLCDDHEVEEREANRRMSGRWPAEKAS